MTDTQAEGRRAELIDSAQATWVSALTDLGGRNTLLYYKDRRRARWTWARPTRKRWTTS
jgi:hypothetical protein